MYYVVHKGHKPGIYTSWQDCKKQVDKFDGAIFKKFSNKDEASQFLKVGFGENKKPRSVVRKENDDMRNKEAISAETEHDENCIFIYTDGSCIRYKAGLVKAGFGIYIPEKSIQVQAPLLNQKLTNNRAELTAIIESIKYLDEWELDEKKICIFTDSQYSMYIYNGTGERYEKNGFRNDKGEMVPNIDLIKQVLEIKRTHSNIVLLKVRAHTTKKDRHSLGNEIADKLAGQGAMGDSNNGKTIFSAENIGPIPTIQMNQLFEQDEIIETKSEIDDEEYIHDEYIHKEEDIIKSVKKKPTKLKNTKLSTWFVKS